MPVTPMFPLGTVLFPGMLLPLHVLESRYRRMVDDCQAGDGTFGVVLIERGSEVGGGDVRTDVGTMARILQARQLPDGELPAGEIAMHFPSISRPAVSQPCVCSPMPSSSRCAHRATGGFTGGGARACETQPPS